mgnify:CR=1 FL=1
MKSNQNKNKTPSNHKSEYEAFRPVETPPSPAEAETPEKRPAAEPAVSAVQPYADKPKGRKKRTGLKVFLIILGILFVLVLLGILFVWNKLRKVNYRPAEESYQTAALSYGTDENQVLRLEDEEEPTEAKPTKEPENGTAEATEPDVSDLGSDEVADINKNIIDSQFGELMYDEDVFNILLLGVDSRTGDNYTRTDSMILVSVDHKHDKIYMNSLMRDLYVHLPGYGFTRLNAANVFGGPQLLLDTVEENFRVRVDRYALVNLHSMARIIDIMGGVDVTVKDYEVNALNNLIRHFNSINNEAPNSGLIEAPGTYHMNGKQAVSYARIRYAGNADFERTERQRRVLGTMFKQMRSASLSQMNSMADAVLPQVMTNLSMGEIAGLMAQAPTILKYELVPGRVPIPGSFSNAYVSGMAVLVPDLPMNIDFISENVYGFTYSEQ